MNRIPIHLQPAARNSPVHFWVIKKTGSVEPLLWSNQQGWIVPPDVVLGQNLKSNPSKDKPYALVVCGQKEKDSLNLPMGGEWLPLREVNVRIRVR